MKDTPRRGQPPNAFIDYPVINEAYSEIRKIVLTEVKKFNKSRSDGLGHWAYDRPVMEYVRSCIPAGLKPAELGTNTSDIQGRTRNILYPYLEAGDFSPQQFADWLDDPHRAKEFTRHWINANEPQPTRGPQPRINLEMLVDADLISRSSALIFRFQGRKYDAKISESYQVIIDLGQGEELFRSPDAVFKKGLKTSLDQWDYCFVSDPDGEEVPLSVLKARYKELKGL